MEEITYDILRCVGTALFSAGTTWGIMKTKMENMENRLTMVETDQRDGEDSYVTYKHLDAVVTPIQDAMAEIQKDIKTILRAVSRG